MMFDIPAPHGGQMQIPGEPADEKVSYPTLSDPAGIRKYYEEQGYVVVRGLIDHPACDQMRRMFDEEIKPFNGFIYRQASAIPERHIRTDHGHMLNSILNIHAVDPRSFPRFRTTGANLITSAPLQQAVRAILGEGGKIVQSMYFEGNPATWAHQDTYYLDSENLGQMVGAWIALEDIAPGAGRFFIYPKSHLVDLALNRGDMSIASNHAGYKKLVIDIIRENGLECRAPALRKGDVLFWGSKTIHGSMETTQPQHSRSSVTAHYIPASARFMQYQTRIKPLSLSTVNGMPVHTPKDLANPVQRLVMEVETRFPKAFASIKKAAVRVVTR
jgi:phytanoyl-CoA hydroxylase